MLSTNNNDYDHIGRERKVIELYNQGKSTRDIAKELRMSLRDISIILKKHGVNHGLAIIDDDDDNKKSQSNNEKHPNVSGGDTERHRFIAVITKYVICVLGTTSVEAIYSKEALRNM